MAARKVSSRRYQSATRVSWPTGIPDARDMVARPMLVASAISTAKSACRIDAWWCAEGVRRPVR